MAYNFLKFAMESFKQNFKFTFKGHFGIKKAEWEEMLISKLKNGKSADQDIYHFFVSLDHLNTEQISVLLMLIFTFYLL